MKYYAVHLKTESGDDYCFLLRGIAHKDITKQIAYNLGEEVAYIYDWNIAADDIADADQVGVLLAKMIKDADREEDEEEEVD